MPRRSGRKFSSKKPGVGYLKGTQRHEMLQDKKLASIDKKVRKLNNEAEVKYHDVNCSVSPIQTSGDLVLLNGINQGASQNLRIGARVKATSLQLRFVMLGAQATNVDSDIIRVIVFWDNDAKGVAPVLVGTPSTPPPALLNNQNGLGIELLDPFQLEQRERFKVIFDKLYTFNPNMAQKEDTSVAGETTVTEIVPVIREDKRYIKLNRVVQYGDTDNAITSINNNSLYLAVFSLSGTSSIQGTSRFSFKDF